MRRFYSFLISITCVSAMAGCDVRGALDSSGRLVGSRTAEGVVDLDSFRIGISEVYVSNYTARRNPIPLTYYFSFNWSPAEVARIHRSKGYRQPNEADWEVYRALIGTIATSTSATDSLFDEARAEARVSDYEHVVWPNNAIGSCISDFSVNKWCGPAPSPSRAEQRRLAQIVLDQIKPGCRIGRTDPEEVAAVADDSQLSWDRRLMVEVLCNTE